MTDNTRSLLEQAATLLNPDRSPSTLYHQRRDCAAAIRAELAKPPTAPAWHDAPETISLKAERDALLKGAERYRWLTEYLVSDDDSYDDQIVAARTVEEITCVIDAAIAKTEGRKE